jgi:hypothetical protein
MKPMALIVPPAAVLGFVGGWMYADATRFPEDINDPVPLSVEVNQMRHRCEGSIKEGRVDRDLCDRYIENYIKTLLTLGLY